MGKSIVCGDTGSDQVFQDLYSWCGSGWLCFVLHGKGSISGEVQHVSLAELIDPELVSDQVFEQIVIAFLICRYGNVVLQEEGLQ